MTGDTAGGCRIVLAPSSYAPALGGVEEVTAKLAEHLQERGHAVRVSTMRWPKSLPHREQVDGIDVARRFFRSPDVRGSRGVLARVTAPVTTAQLVREHRRFQPDVVHIHCVSHAAAYQARAARSLGVPIVVTLHGELTADATNVFRRAARLRRSLRDLLADADAVTACSHATLLEAEEWFGSSLGERGTVIFNGVELDEFRHVMPMRHDRPYVFALGRHVPQKGFDVLVDAMAEVLGRRPSSLGLVLAGDGPETARLEEQARRRGIDTHVSLVGRTNRAETARWFRGAEMFVSPSRQEAFGVVNLEAQAAGTPVIATTVGGVPEVVADRETGLLVPPDDPAALAEAILRMIDNGGLRHRLVDNAAAAVEKFRWATIAERYLAAYQSALAGHVTQ